jgi:hypothetical protein
MKVYLLWYSAPAEDYCDYGVRELVNVYSSREGAQSYIDEYARRYAISGPIYQYSIEEKTVID